MTGLMDGTPVTAAVVVARVPVVDSARAIVGFELVNRSTQDPATSTQADVRRAVATDASLPDAVDVELAGLVGDKLLFCAVDREVLLSEHRLTLPPRRIVLEVPTDDVDADLLASVQGYKEAGFTIMVRHEAWTEKTAALLALADLVKVDLRSGEPGAVMDVVDGYAELPVDLVAAGCDTEAQLDWAQAVGFDLFVGRGVQVYEKSSESTSAPLPVSQLQLGLELLSHDLDLDRVEDVLRGDPALVAQLLTMASTGAGGGLRRQVRSLREALVVMGTVRIRQWAALVILSRHSQRETDALVTTLVRARMCELLARNRGVDGPFAFTAGLLSALHVLLGVPAADVEQQVKVDQDLADAAFGRRGPVGRLINRVVEHEQSLVTDSRPAEDHDEVTLIGAMAFGWAASYAEAMEAAAPA